MSAMGKWLCEIEIKEDMAPLGNTSFGWKSICFAFFPIPDIINSEVVVTQEETE